VAGVRDEIRSECHPSTCLELYRYHANPCQSLVSLYNCSLNVRAQKHKSLQRSILAAAKRAPFKYKCQSDLLQAGSRGWGEHWDRYPQNKERVNRSALCSNCPLFPIPRHYSNTSELFTRYARFYAVSHWSRCYEILRPPLWSSGQSSSLQIQRSRFRFPALPHFLRSSGSVPLSLVGITEELLEWKSSGSGSRKPRLTAVGICCADHASPCIRKKSWH
jgi:hypothetical protein